MGDSEYERIWRAMYDHRLMPRDDMPGVTYVDVCACGTAIYSTPHYYFHVYQVALAIQANPHIRKVTDRHIGPLEPLEVPEARA